MNDDNVQEVMGMLVPLLLGGSIQDFLKKLFVGTKGASANDSLMELQQKYQSMGNATYGNLPNSQNVSDAIDKRLSNIGINPYSGAGQGLNGILMSIAGTGIFSGLAESLIGVPQFSGMAQMARVGSIGINAASGTSYSVLDEPRMMRGMDVAMQRMRTMYDFSVSDDGREVTEYTHGLTGDEMGLINQRILSSKAAYTRKQGNGGGEYDTNTDEGAEEFTRDLKEMGQKFNSVAATLNKITGSMEETMRLLDGLAGGNFLGGTKEEAEAVANRARKMAAAIRISASEAGMTPQEAYKNMQDTTAGIGMALGLNDVSMNAGGGAAMFKEISAQTQQTFAKWKRDHPGASVEQQEAAKLGIMNSVMRYEQSGAGAMALLVAQNKDKFSEDQIKFIQDAYGSGNAKAAQAMVRDVVGAEQYSGFMSNEGAQIAARKELMSRRPEDEGRNLLLDLGRRGASSAAAEAANYIARKHVESGIRRAASVMGAYGEDGAVDENEKKSKAAEFEAIKSVAKEWGISEEQIKRFSPEDPESFMDYMKGMAQVAGKSVAGLERQVNGALIESQKKLIDDNTMNDDEQEAAAREISKMADESLGEGAIKDGIKKMVKEGRLEEAYNALSKASGMTSEETRETGRRIFKGRITRSKANSLKADYKDAEAQFSNDLTEEEKKRVVDDAMRERQDEYRHKYEKLRQDDSQTATDFLGNIGRGLNEKELVRARDAKREKAAIAREASADTMKDLLGGKIGSKSGEDFDKISKEWSQDISDKIMKGSTFEDAFLSVLKEKGVSSGAFENQEALDKALEYYKSGDGKKKVGKANETYKQAVSEKKTRKDKENNVAAIAREASADTMKDLLDGSIGEKSGEDFDLLSEEWSQDISDKIMKGSTFKDAFIEVLKEKGVSSGAFKDQKALDDMVAYYTEGAGKDKIKKTEKTFKTKALGRTNTGKGKTEIRIEDIPLSKQKEMVDTRANAQLAGEATNDQNQALANMSSAGASQSQTDLTTASDDAVEALEARDLELAKKNGPYLDKVGDNSSAAESLKNAEESIEGLRGLIKNSKLEAEDIKELQDKGSASEAFKTITKDLSDADKTKYSITLEGMRETNVAGMLSLTDEEYNGEDEKSKARRQSAVEGVAKYQGKKDPSTGEDSWTTELLDFLRKLVEVFSESNFRRILQGVTVKTKEG